MSVSRLTAIVQRFCKEAIRWKALNHRNVLQLLGVTMGEGQFVMVSEWMENGNINEYIRSHADADLFKLVSPRSHHRAVTFANDLPTAQRRRQGAGIHARPGNGTWRLEGGMFLNTNCASHSNPALVLKANILIDQDFCARLADFGFLTVVSDPASSSCIVGGTIQWMSPELFALDQTGLKNCRPTKQSDCYALGMVIYEVLSGQVPFAPFGRYVVIRKVIDGEHPQRPGGAEGERFTDDLWRMLNRCWATRPESRPSSLAVLECLERVSRDTRLPYERFRDDGGAWNLTKNFFGAFSWLDFRYLVGLLRRFLR